MNNSFVKTRNICIVTNCTLPVPDTKGGAVERLVTMIAEDNERWHRFNITIITNFEEESNKLQKKFYNSTFVHLKSFYSNRITSFIHRLHWQFVNRLHWHPSWIFFFSSPVNYFLVKHRDEFDMIIGECAGYDYCAGASLIIGRDKFCVHLHGNKQADWAYEQVYGNVVSVSNYILDKYRESSNLPLGRTATVFNGIATENFCKRITEDEKHEIRTKLGLKDEDFVVIFCGRIRKDKGVKELMEAIVSINKPDIKLIVMGSSDFGNGDYGEYPQQVKEIVERNKDKIIFTGFIPNYKLYKYHQISNVGVVPSTHQDPCPLSLFELITSGLPTIATRVGGIPEIGTNKTTIFIDIETIVEDLQNAILKLYNNRELCLQMSVESIKRSEYFSRKRFYTDFCDTIDRFIELNKK